MTGPAPTAVVFDLGGVLIDWDPRYLYRKLMRGDEAAVERFMAEVWSDAWNLSLDRGRRFVEAIPELVAAHPGQRAAIEAYRDGWIESIGGPIHDAVAVLEALHARGVPLWAITNWSAETFPLVRDDPTYGFLDRFERILVSGELGMIKPDAAIFEHALTEIGRPPADCLFVDDNPANVEAARRAGMTAHHFRGAGGLADELRGYGLIG